MVSFTTIQSYYTQAEQFRRDRSLHELKCAFQKHFLEKVPNRIPELIIALSKQIFPNLATTLTNLAPQLTTIRIISHALPEWKEVAQLTEVLRRKAEMPQPVYPCISTSKESKIAAWGNYIIFNQYLLNSSQIQKEFIIMHELMHIHLSHLPVRVRLSHCFAIIDLILLYYCPLTIFLVEVLAFYIESRVCYYQEKQADLEAINKLKSNVGAIALYQERMNKVCVLHDYEKLSSHQKVELRKIQQIACNYSEITHPSMTERLKYCTIK